MATQLEILAARRRKKAAKDEARFQSTASTITGSQGVSRQAAGLGSEAENLRAFRQAAKKSGTTFTNESNLLASFADAQKRSAVKTTPSPTEVFKTPAERAADLARARGAGDLTTEIAGAAAGSETILDIQKAERDRLEQVEGGERARKKSILAQQIDDAKREARATLAAGRQSFAESPEGVQTTGAIGAEQRFTGITGARLESSLKRFESISAAIDENERELKRKRDIGDAKAIRNLSAERDTLKTAAAEAELALEEQQASAKTEAQRLADNKLDTLLGLDASVLATMTPEALGVAFQGAGFDPLLGGSVILAAQQAAEAQKGKDEQAIAQAQANLQKTIAEIGQVGVIKPTAAIQDLQFLNQLEASGADQGLIDAFKARAGITDKITPLTPTSDITPTGKLETATFNNREVTLDSGALAAFSFANDAAVKAGLGELKIGAVDSSSTRNQEKLIANLAQKNSIGFNSENPNETAQKLRDLGINIANVGFSKHEQGLAVDIFPDQSYIAQVKPILEANGWVQTIPVGDAGHFEFKGKIAGSDAELTLQASTVAKNLGGKSEFKERNFKAAFDLLKSGKTLDEVEDKLRLSGFGTAFEGTIKRAFEFATTKGFTGPQKRENQEALEDILQETGANSIESKQFLLKLASDTANADTKKRVDGRIDALFNISEIEKLLEDYAAAGGDTGLLTGAVEGFQQKVLKTTGDAELANIANQIQLSIVDYRQAVSGAAFTESESVQYDEIFPSIGKSPELNAAKMKALKAQFGRNANNFYRTQLGRSNFEELFPGGVINPLLGIGDDPTITFEPITDLVQVKTIKDQIQSELDTGTSIEEIRQELIKRNIDPNQFLNPSS